MTRDVIGASAAVIWAILMVLWLAHAVVWRVLTWVQDQTIAPPSSWA